MAQILVQRKRKNYWWIWLLLLIIVVGVLFYLYTQGMLGDLNKNKINSTTTTGIPQNGYLIKVITA